MWGCLSVATISRMARALADLIADNGPMSKDDAREWVMANDDADPAPLSAGRLNFVMGYGAQNARGWWHDAGEGILAPGPKAGSKASSKNGSRETDDEDEDAAVEGADATLKDRPGAVALTAPEQLLFDVARTVGLNKEKANVFARYSALTYDIHDPEQVAKAIEDMGPDVQPGQKRRLLTAWASASGMQLPADVVKKHFPNGPEIKEQLSVAGASKPGTRRYMALEGEVVPTDATDEDGMSFNEALRLALLQKRSNGGLDDQNQSILAVLLREHAETDRKRMDIAANQPQRSSDNGTSEILTTVFKENAETERTRMRIEEERRSSAPVHNPEEGLFALMFRENAATERTRIEANSRDGQNGKSDLSVLLAQQQANSDTKMEAFMARLESTSREHALHMEGLQKQHSNDMELMRLQSANQMETFKLSMELERQQHAHERELMAMQQGDPDPIAPLNRLVPGLWDKLISGLLNPQAAAGPQVTVSLGDGNQVPFETFERFENLKMKRQMLDTVVQQVPSFIEAGLTTAKMLEAESQNRVANGPMMQQEQMIERPVQQLVQPRQQTLSPQSPTVPQPMQQGPQPPRPPQPVRTPDQRVPIPQQQHGQLDPQLVNTNCAVCGVGIGYPPGSEAFICPSCQTKQFISGEVIMDQAPPPPAPPRPQVVPDETIIVPPSQPVDLGDDDEGPVGLDYPAYTGGDDATGRGS